MALVLPLRWDEDRDHSVDRHIVPADESNPDHYLYKRMEKNRYENESDMFFVNQNGDRCIWRTAIDFVKDLEDELWNHGWGSDMRPLKEIDAPRFVEIRKEISHPSERGWNLPRHHRRHLMKFPGEILNMVFYFCLVGPINCSLQPDVYGPMRLGIQGLSNYTTIGWERQWNSVLSIPCEDENGSYFELRRATSAPLDATFLRASKEMFAIGLPIMYRQNKFFFPMVKSEYERQPLDIFPPDGLCHHQPRIEKGSLRQINKAISGIRNQVDYFDLPNWARMNPFLGFLHVIGPARTTLLKTIIFSGCAITRNCLSSPIGCEGYSTGDLRSNLLTYIPFINEFCPGLTKLILYVYDDDTALNFRSALTSSPLVMPRNCEGSLQSLFETHIRRLENVEEFVVYNNDKEDAVLLCAGDAMKWFRDRTARRARLRNVSQKEEAMNNECWYCGEEHVWPDCPNLCDRCGGYGHLRNLCTKRLK